MKKHEAQAIIETIQRLVDEDGPGPRRTPDPSQADSRPRQFGERLPAAVEKTGGSPAPAPARCDHKFVDGNKCMKCGIDAKMLLAPFDEEALYQRFKARFLEEARIDPVLLHLIAAQPEIVVEVEPRIVTLDGSNTRGRVARLMAAGWFRESRTAGDVRAELKRTGTDPGGGGTLYDILAVFKRDGFLAGQNDGYQLAPGVKVTERELQVR